MDNNDLIREYQSLINERIETIVNEFERKRSLTMEPDPSDYEKLRIRIYEDPLIKSYIKRVYEICPLLPNRPIALPKGTVFLK